MGPSIRTGRVLGSLVALALLVSGSIYGRLRFSARRAAAQKSRFGLRLAVDEYTFDKERPPQSVKDLIEAGYLRNVPVDPLTGKDLPIPESEQDVH